MLRSAYLLPMLLGGVACLAAAPGIRQTKQTASQTGGPTIAPDASQQMVLKVDARTVALDVVVTGKDGRPVVGLHREDFAVAEDGKPQTITFFEEHGEENGGKQATAPGPAKELPPNTFTNVPQVPPTDSLTVLLLDSLNTPQNDQRFVHAQILKFLKTVQPGRHMAIFTLGTHLRFVQGFSDDPAALEAALNNPKLGTNPKGSPLLPSDQEKSTDQQIIAAMQEHDSAGASALINFLMEQQIEQTDVRMKLTLAAFQELGHYLAGFPGRKNIIWFSGSFPLTIFPPVGGSIDSQRFNNEEVMKTDELLSSAQVAVYPVGAQGVATSVIFDGEHQLAGVSNGQQARQQIANDVQAETNDRDASESSMDQIAQDTGGIAIRDTNGLVDAIHRVLEHGSAYYTLTYTPANGASDGKFRKIQVKLAGTARSEGVRLAYRQGYYALDAKISPNQAAETSGVDPLRPLMDLGMPASTQVPLVLRVQRNASGTEVAGDNTALGGTRTRYAVTFNINAKDLQFHADSDGSEHDKVEVTLLVYNQEGKPLNWLVRAVALDMDAARFARVQNTGIHFKMEIDAPQDGLALRSGIYDLNSGRAGTLEIPLSSVATTEPVANIVETTVSPGATAPKSAPALVGPASESPGKTAASNGAPAPAANVPAAATASTSIAKKAPISFWSLPPERVDDWLLHGPSADRERYDRLREEFAGLHCSAYLMQEQPSGRKDGKNLICSLPGKDSSQIVVVARYDRISGALSASRWSEALMLPLLYNALRAQTRQHTFVFAAIDGASGEKAFFDDLRKRGQSPGTLVVLDSIGLGFPSIYVSDPGGSKKGRETAAVRKLLESDALVSASVLQFPNPFPVWAGVAGTSRATAPVSIYNSILDREDKLPAVLIQSSALTTSSIPPGTDAAFPVAKKMSAEAFHQDFNFAAYFLCRIDADLSSPAL